MDVGYYAPAARTTQNLAVFIVFLGEIDLRLANPRVHTLWARAGAFRHPAAHLGSGTNPRGGPTIMMCFHANLIASVCSCKERVLRTPEAGTPVAWFRF